MIKLPFKNKFNAQTKILLIKKMLIGAFFLPTFNYEHEFVIPHCKTCRIPNPEIYSSQNCTHIESNPSVILTLDGGGVVGF